MLGIKVGASDGDVLGVEVGDSVDACAFVGAVVSEVGDAVGLRDGLAVGTILGVTEGEALGLAVGVTLLSQHAI